MDMNRRNCLGLLGGAAAGAALAGGIVPALGQGAAANPLWTVWKARYLDASGRVIDHLQQNASHSEGQGYGMLLAAHFGDAEAFERMYAWTEGHLAVRDDRLLSWRWLPEGPARVPDRNNASDGDLFYAWALVRGSRVFGRPAYQIRAAGIAEDLVARCIVMNPADRATTLFLPAHHGFVHDGAVTINPSYYMPRAMSELGTATGQSALNACAAHGERLLATIAADGLVPDWVQITARGWREAPNMSPNAGYEAIRVGLFLSWSGLFSHPAVQQSARAWRATLSPERPVPVVMERTSGVVLEASPDPGYRAVAAFVICAGSGQSGAMVPPFTGNQPYYPATLHLLSMIAQTEAVQGCTPV
jgi:endoglucanase